ncbi:DNA polymerase III subunit gamma and tau [Gulosibacter sp. ACHW.36C]|uniref:DNA-directed DNA polymerase n=1 Tax=Gulosibacter sediminis TaxID=1729695 RepID=A0ABY4MYR0_9MICO|nr:DNA polymerase III subunit gamma and tau [Gulosibacter sediminis]UQN14516.1 DNA polymerase III subunit gamma and tau [Gulosibacter sediminis]
MVAALYRRYRPETFAEMIGQQQVTDPLSVAIRSGRINHAYLFSGPRGCGKTSSARILARCLNCAEGPTPEPCGKCDSCLELGREGGGSLDVAEIDAASHGGVDDARELRERAVMAPSRDRYRIFIIDEAHMVTSQGFNALLKVVEEPPEHVLFIFATTEPEKVIGTIRSRTHHYPFRLIPPAPMLEYLERICAAEGISAEPGVLPLVVRAGGGSARDTMSLLDQLIAGTEGETMQYQLATQVLGFTAQDLLDETIAAFADGDASAAYRSVDSVIQSGQDPRRFVEDLLERVRDLIVVKAIGQGAEAVLRGISPDELERMHTNAARFTPRALSGMADAVNATLSEMTGVTAPRLQLELMIARVLVAQRAAFAEADAPGAAPGQDARGQRDASGQRAPGQPDAPGRGAPAADRGQGAAPTRAPHDERPAPQREPERAPQRRPEPEAPKVSAAEAAKAAWATPGVTDAGPTVPPAGAAGAPVSREGGQQADGSPSREPGQAPGARESGQQRADSAPTQANGAPSSGPGQAPGAHESGQQRVNSAPPQANGSAAGARAGRPDAPEPWRTEQPAASAPAPAESGQGSTGASGSARASANRPDAGQPEAGQGAGRASESTQTGAGQRGADQAGAKQPDAGQVQDAWPSVLEAVNRLGGRSTWSVVRGLQPLGYADGVLALWFPNRAVFDQARQARDGQPSPSDHLKSALREVFGVDMKIAPKIERSPGRESAAPAADAPSAPSDEERHRGRASQAPAPAATSGGGATWNVAPIPGEPRVADDGPGSAWDEFATGPEPSDAGQPNDPAPQTVDPVDAAPTNAGENRANAANSGSDSSAGFATASQPSAAASAEPAGSDAVSSEAAAAEPVREGHSVEEVAATDASEREHDATPVAMPEATLHAAPGTEVRNPVDPASSRSASAGASRGTADQNQTRQANSETVATGDQQSGAEPASTAPAAPSWNVVAVPGSEPEPVAEPEPEPEPEEPAAPKHPALAAGQERYGESVIRERLGARFVGEELRALPGPSGPFDEAPDDFEAPPEEY